MALRILAPSAARSAAVNGTFVTETGLNQNC